MTKWLFLLLLISSNCLATGLPDHLQDLLEKSQDCFLDYGRKSSSEIDDGQFDDSELFLFSQIDQVNSLDVIFSKEDIKNLKMEIIKSISQTFNEDQLASIIKIGKSSPLNKKSASRFFEVALEYKLSRVSLADIHFSSALKL